MARKDEIFKSFLQHGILKENYRIKKTDLPSTVREGLKSEIPIVKSIALIVDGLESPTQITDAALRNSITQYLNDATI
jgi:hypothetical protein